MKLELSCCCTMTIKQWRTSQHCQKLDRVKLLKVLREAVVHSSADIITSDTSVSLFGGHELSRKLELVNHLQGVTGPSLDLPSSRDLFHTSCSRAKGLAACKPPCCVKYCTWGHKRDMIVWKLSHMKGTISQTKGKGCSKKVICMPTTTAGALAQV
ncbi:hypothetical protein BDR05DRAFT_739529 [Suillus weaverae]|nr:hypothetical protein BDR05DRAFT_739529 [Suillus weaverae]